ncbi:MAG: ACT domain-containing protein, partial [Bacillota bacterium]
PSGGGIEIRSDRPAVGVAHVAPLAQVVVSGRRDFNQGALNARLLEAVARKGVSIDLILVSPHQLMFTVPEQAAPLVHEAVSEFEDVEVALTGGLAKVSVVGAGMHGVPGVMARIARALTSAGIDILQTSDSHASISCLVDAERLPDAIRALFSEFDLGRER